MANRYLVVLKFLVHLNSHLVFEFEGEIKFIAFINHRHEINSLFTTLALHKWSCKHTNFSGLLDVGLTDQWFDLVFA
jgi:hypothetical protein